jgi:D-glycerate 3-kinase
VNQRPFGADDVPALLAQVQAWRAAAGRPLLIGLSGPQGSGKSTAAKALAAALPAGAIAVVGLDDVYLPRAARAALAANVHPLLATRGVPGTHDLPLLHATLDALLAGTAPVALPQFSKGDDDRAALAEWPIVPPPSVAVLLEGWCVGAVVPDLLACPNALEREADADGRWRRHWATALAVDYARLWQRLDRLISFTAPDWDVVCGWRAEAEARQLAAGQGGMDSAGLARFMQHYERLGRALLAAPAGDLVYGAGQARWQAAGCPRRYG